MIQILAHRGDAIMTTAASTQYLEVINRYRRIPQVGAVTVFTDIGRADVVQRFASSGHAIVAVATTLGFNILMIEVCGYPTSGTVTVVALCCSGQVIKILTHGGDAIVAAAAATQYLEVINRYRRIPQVGRVAILTNIGRADVIE